MRSLVRWSLALAFVSSLLATEWWLSRHLEVSACLKGGHVFD